MDGKSSNMSYLWKSLLKKWKESKKEANRRNSEVSTATSFLMRLASRKKKGHSKKELHRARTMPAISVSSVLTKEELAQHGILSNASSSNSASASSAASSSSSSATSSASGRGRRAPGIMRKMSHPESFFRGIQEDAPSPKKLQTESKSALKKCLRSRSQSENRLWKTRRKSADVKQGSAWSFEDDRNRKASSGSFESKVEEWRPTSQLFYTTPPRANMVRSASNEKRLETSSSSGNLQKLSRRLVLKDKKETLSPSRNRSISLDCGDARAMKFFSSSDDTSMDVVGGLSASPSAPAYLSNKDGEHYSPKVMRDLRLAGYSQKKKSLSIDVPDSQLPGKRKSEKEKRSLYDPSSLFDAVEQQDLDLVKVILDSNFVDINSLNSENLTVLDIAVMTNNIPIAKMLLTKGAKESPVFQRGDCRVQRLESLVGEAEKRMIDLTAAVLNGSSGNANISPAQQKENEKQLSYWEFRHRLLKRMKSGYDHARPPEPPSNVRLDVASNSSLLVSFEEPQSHNGAVVTRYKVEWSSFENFLPLSGEAIVEDLSRLEFEIKNLTRANTYYVRVCGWNVKGYGVYAQSDPTGASPSSWREVDNIPSRLEGKVESLHTLFHQVKRSRPPEASEMKDILTRGADSPMQKKRISIKNLFVSAPKFQKTIKRGVYMACLLFNEDRILVTSEEQLPIVEVDETFSGPSVQTDLYWLLKVACMWEEVKVLKQDMEKTSSAGSTFRCKLLQAIIALQSGLGIQDLGQFFHRPVRDSHGSTVITVVNNVRDPKLVTLGSCKWVTFGKLARRQSLSSAVEVMDAHSLLVSAVPEMIMYNQVSGLCLQRGLYLGYIKLQASVEVLRVMVPNKMPSCVPHVKIRDCPNVSREEWEWLQKSADSSSLGANLTQSQENFQQILSKAVRKLFTQLGLSDDVMSTHRLYDLEVLELSPTVAMILVLPSIEDICMVPGHSDSLATKTDYTFLPVQIFESIHMNAYLPEFFSLYARLSAIVEMDGVLAQQGHREAFSSEELSKAKEQVEVTAHLQQNLDRVWKCARWIRDITTYARSRERKAGIQLSHILGRSGTSSSFSGNRSSLIQSNGTHHKASANTSWNFSHNNRSNVISVGKDNRRIAKFFDPNEETPHSSDSISVGGMTTGSMDSDTTKPGSTTSVPSTPSQQHPPFHPKLSPSSSVSSLSTTASSSSQLSPDQPQSPPDFSSGIIKVHALYETGLNKSVNIKLHITEHTTSRDIVNLVVRHLNTVVKNKGKAVLTYPEESLNNFCLVLKFQGHEKVLRDDFKLLQLKGQLQRAKVCVTMVDTMFSESELGEATVV